jgi:phospholipase/carboxylesterase
MIRMRVLFVVLFGTAAVGCKPEAPAIEQGRERIVAGVRFVEVFTQGADETSPLLIGLHGRGGSPERFLRNLHEVPVRLEIAAARAPLPYGGGGQWFDWPPGMTEGALADAISAAEAALWPAIAELAHGRKVLIAGFSQGAVLTYAIAARHPDNVAYAFPIAGLMPDQLLPRGSVRTAPVYALHGIDDTVIPVAASREAVEAFRGVGTTAELHEFAGVGHSIAPAMRDDLIAHVRAAAAAVSAPTPR